MQRGAGLSLAHPGSHCHWEGHLLKRTSPQRATWLQEVPGAGGWRAGLGSAPPPSGDTHHSPGRARRSSPAPRAAGPASGCGFVCPSLPACSRSRSGQCSAERRTGSPLSGRRKKALAEGIPTEGGAECHGAPPRGNGRRGRMVYFFRNVEAFSSGRNPNKPPLWRRLPVNRSFPPPNSGQLQSLGKLSSTRTTRSGE